jgi:hypothetical protein
MIIGQASYGKELVIRRRVDLVIAEGPLEDAFLRLVFRRKLDGGDPVKEHAIAGAARVIA